MYVLRINGKNLPVVKTLYLGGVLLMLSFAYVLVDQFINREIPLGIPTQNNFFYFLLGLLLLITFLLANKLFRFPKANLGKLILLDWFFHTVLLSVLLATIAILFVRAQALPRINIFWVYGIFFGLVIGFRYMQNLIQALYRQISNPHKSMVIIGAGLKGTQLFEYVHKNHQNKYKILGYLDDMNGNTMIGADQVVGSVDDFASYFDQNKVQEVFCALPSYADEKIKAIQQYCEQHLIRFRKVYDEGMFVSSREARVQFGNLPIVLPRHEPLQSTLSQGVKRLFDILFSGFVLLFVFPPVLLVIGTMIKLTSKGPVFFLQRRNGQHNKEFRCWKFRTMVVNDQSDSKQATKDDPRVTPIGAFLRKTNLDELPQFINVFKGDMSVVGPRPHPIKLNESFKDVVEKYMARHFVKPGVTGLAQVNGFRGETREKKQMQKRIQYDIHYIGNWSLWLDIKIVFLTIWNMVHGEENAY